MATQTVTPIRCTFITRRARPSSPRKLFLPTVIFTRLVGLLGKTRRWAQLGRGLWIVPSRGVHTIGMLFPIDLIFIGKDKEVVYVEEYVRPFRISKVSLKATSVLELPPHTIYRSGTKIGDQLEIAPTR